MWVRPGLGMRSFLKISVLALILAGLPVFEISALGHSPHDPVDALALSPAYHEDKTVFISIGRHLKKSEDGGASWKSLIRGIETDRPVASVAVSPSFRDDGTLFVGTADDFIYKSTDRGLSWTMVSRGKVTGGVVRIRISPNYSRDGVVLAAGGEGGLIITRDAGLNWVELFSPAKKIGDMAFAPGTGDGAVLACDDSGRLHVSEDACRTWRELLHLPESGGITAIAVSPSFPGDRTVFLGTRDSGVFKTTDGGKSFTEKSSGLTNKHVVSLAISPTYEKDGAVLASTWFEAIFKSDSRGQTWVLHAKGLTTDKQADSPEYLSPHFREIAISSRFDEDKTSFLGGFDGLFKSTDSGTTWGELETLPVGLIEGMALAVNEAGNHVISLITYGGGAYFSQDGGNAWAINNRGLRETRLMDVVFSPAYRSDNTVYSASRGALLKSVDGGRNWNRYELKDDVSFWDRPVNFLRRWTKRVERVFGTSDFLSRRLFQESTAGTRPYPTTVALSPSFEQDKTLFFGTRWHGVYKSTDGGANCFSIGRKLERVIFLSLSPAYEADRTVFASSLGKGLYKSEDGGKSWREINKGLPAVFAQGETADDIISMWKAVGIMVSPGYAEDKTVFAGTPQGFFKSGSRGEKWERAGRNSVVHEGHIAGMGISPLFGADRTLMVSVRGKGLFRSTDGGATFEEIAPQLIRGNHILEFIEFSTKYDEDHTVYAASEEHVFRSKDRGDTWEKLKRPVRYENHRDVIKYRGKWAIREQEGGSAGGVSFSDVIGDIADLDFVGEGVRWIGTTGPDQGIARVFIDGLHVKDVDLYSETRKQMVELHSVSGLPNGPHSIRVEVGAGKNAMSSGLRVEIEAFDVF